jgi:hypothetical protein
MSFSRRRTGAPVAVYTRWSRDSTTPTASSPLTSLLQDVPHADDLASSASVVPSQGEKVEFNGHLWNAKGTTHTTTPCTATPSTTNSQPKRRRLHEPGALVFNMSAPPPECESKEVTNHTHTLHSLLTTFSKIPRSHIPLTVATTPSLHPVTQSPSTRTNTFHSHIPLM